MDAHTKAIPYRWTEVIFVSESVIRGRDSLKRV
jgi:hypothetical protein